MLDFFLVKKGVLSFPVQDVVAGSREGQNLEWQKREEREKRRGLTTTRDQERNEREWVHEKEPREKARREEKKWVIRESAEEREEIKVWPKKSHIWFIDGNAQRTKKANMWRAHKQGRKRRYDFKRTKSQRRARSEGAQGKGSEKKRESKRKREKRKRKWVEKDQSWQHETKQKRRKEQSERPKGSIQKRERERSTKEEKRLAPCLWAALSWSVKHILTSLSAFLLFASRKHKMHAQHLQQVPHQTHPALSVFTTTHLLHHPLHQLMSCFESTHSSLLLSKWKKRRGERDSKRKGKRKKSRAKQHKIKSESKGDRKEITRNWRSIGNGKMKKKIKRNRNESRK